MQPYLSKRYQEIGTPRNSEYPEAHRNSNAKWKKENPEHQRAYKAKRRSRAKLSPQSRKKTIAHRKRIKNDGCYYCGKRTSNMVDEHVYPLSRGGTDHWFNIVRACDSCNSRKNNKTGSEFLAQEGGDPTVSPRRAAHGTTEGGAV